MRPLVPPVPLIVIEKVPPVVPETLQVPVAVLPEARVMVGGHETVTEGSLAVAETVTTPTKPLVVVGLPRLVEVIPTCAVAPGAIVTPAVELLVKVKPLTKIVIVPPVRVERPVAATAFL
jgi:hypothetical protein